MKLPYISRNKHLQELGSLRHNLRSRIVIYEPVEYPAINGKPIRIPGNGYCFHDRRIGWVKSREFDTYADYIDYMKALKS